MGQTTFFDGLMEQVEFEHKLFESVLHVNFRKVQALKEDGDISSEKDPDEGPDVATTQTSEGEEQTTDDAKKKLIEQVRAKLAEAWSNFIKWIKQVAETVANKIKNIIFTDNTIIKKYNELLITKPELLKGFGGLGDDFKAANVNDYELPVEEVKKLVSKSDYLFDYDCQNNCKIIEQRLESAFIDAGKGFDWSAYNWTKAFEYLNNDKLSVGIISAAKALAATEGSIKQKILDKGFDLKVAAKNKAAEIGAANKAKAAGEDKEFAAENRAGAANPFNTLAGENFHIIQGTMKNFISTYAAYFKAIRRSCIACGTYALKAAKGGEAATNEAMAWLADVQCTQFLDESFAFV